MPATSATVMVIGSAARFVGTSLRLGSAQALAGVGRDARPSPVTRPTSLPTAMRLAVAVALAVVAAGCNSRALPPPPGAPPAPPRPPPGATPPAHRAQVVVAEPGALGPLDPALGPAGPEADVLVNVYGRLVELDPALQPSAGLATGWRHAGATAWDFSLRKGVTFSDGEPFDAGTVTAWFDRLQRSGQTAALASVSGVQRVDAMTVRFETRQPDPLLPRRLASLGASITPPGPFQGGDAQALAARPVGTGPYLAADVVPGERVTLVPNSHYWGPAPRAQEVEIRAIPDGAARAAALRQGAVDVALDLPVAEVPAIKAAAGLEVPPVLDARRVARISLDTVTPGPLADARVRQALNYAVDKQAIIDGILAGQAVQNATLAAQGAFGYCPGRTYPYDPARARALLQDAGVAGLTLDLAYAAATPASAPNDEVVEALAQSMRAAGVAARPAPTSGAGPPEGAVAWYGSAVTDVLDADESFRAVQGPSGLAAPFGGQALLLYEQERRETNDAKRAGLACDIHQLEQEAAPVVFLWQEDLLTGLSRKTVAWTVSGDGLVRLDRLTPVAPPG